MMRIIVPRDAPLWAHALVREIERQLRRPVRATLRMPVHAVADLPDAADWSAGLIFVPDDAGGPVPAFSDGAQWRRVTDRAPIS